MAFKRPRTNPLADFMDKVQNSIGNVIPRRPAPTITDSQVNQPSQTAQNLDKLSSPIDPTKRNADNTFNATGKKQTGVETIENGNKVKINFSDGTSQIVDKKSYNESIGNIPKGETSTISPEAQALRDIPVNQAKEQQMIADNQLQQLQGQIGNIGKDNSQSQLISSGELGAGLALGGVGAGIGAGLGALFAPVTAGASIPIGLGVAGLISGSIFQIGKNEKGNVAQAFTTYKKAKYNMAKYQSFVNKGVMSPQQAVVAWNQELINIRQAKATIREANKNSLNKFLSGGAQELADIESFERLLPSLNSAFAGSLVNPTGQEVNFGVDLTELQ